MDRAATRRCCRNRCAFQRRQGWLSFDRPPAARSRRIALTISLPASICCLYSAGDVIRLASSVLPWHCFVRCSSFRRLVRVCVEWQRRCEQRGPTRHPSVEKGTKSLQIPHLPRKFGSSSMCERSASSEPRQRLFMSRWFHLWRSISIRIDMLVTDQIPPRCGASLRYWAMTDFPYVTRRFDSVCYASADW